MRFFKVSFFIIFSFSLIILPVLKIEHLYLIINNKYLLIKKVFRAQNYIMSLNGDMNKNSIMNKMLENQTFGIGFSLLTSSNDRLAIQLKMNSTDYLNQIPKYDTFIFINSFVQM